MVEQVRRQGQLWLERRLQPGEFFGQQGLYSRTYSSTAFVEEPGYLFFLSAAGLRKLLELVPTFLDTLLPEKRAQRLRGIPLLRELNDAEIRWLALVSQEHTFNPGDTIPLNPPGLWLIDYGWIGVQGPAAGGQQPWRLTAGNFFLTPQALDGSECEVAAAVCDSYRSHLFFLPEGACGIAGHAGAGCGPVVATAPRHRRRTGPGRVVQPGPSSGRAIAITWPSIAPGNSCPQARTSPRRGTPATVL